MLRKAKNQKGITITEVVIYIAILTIISGGIISVIIQIVNIKTQSDSIAMISHEVMNLFEDFTYEIRNCTDFNLVDETHLIVMNNGDTVEYYLSDGNIYKNENGTDYQITSNLITITNLTFEDWTSTASDNLVHIEIEASRGGLNEEFQVSIHKR